MKRLKKIGVLLLSAIMLLAMSSTVFAATASYEARLYKTGKFDPQNLDSNLSMGNAAVLDAEIEQVDNKRYVIEIMFDTDFEAMGFLHGYLKELTLTNGNYSKVTDGTPAEALQVNQYSLTKVKAPDSNSSDLVAINKLTLVLGSAPELPLGMNAKFSSSIWLMPKNVSGDLYILYKK